MGSCMYEQQFKKTDYCIPLFQVTEWSNFSNQPANDGVEVVSDDADDTGKLTIIGTTNGTNNVVYETITLNGTTAVSTTKTNWGNIYGAFLGDIYGRNSSVAEGTITIREASGNAAITTITAGNRSKGLIMFNLAGRSITLYNKTGLTYYAGGEVVPTTNNSFQYNPGMTDDMCVENYLYLLGDATGSTVSIKVHRG